MASIRCRKDTGSLLMDFSYKGVRCREQTALPDTPANRKRLTKLMSQIEAEIAAGKFHYRKYFPNSHLADKFDPMPAQNQVVQPIQYGMAIPVVPQQETPIFAKFADEWFGECEVRWRKSYRETITDILRLHLKPEFGEKAVSQISKADILKFRSSLSKVQIRKNQRELSASRINYIMMTLRQIVTEAADRFNYNNPYRSIKPLKVKKSDVHPFSIDEVQQIFNAHPN